MKLRTMVFMACWLLLSFLVPAMESPTAKMFKGQVTAMDTGMLSLKERSTEACRQWAAAGDGTCFFTAWAFPVFERVNSCQRHLVGSENGPMAVKNQNGRIIVNLDQDHGLNISEDSAKKSTGNSWGVLIFLNQVEKGRCQISDVQLLAPDRTYDLGGERLAWLGTADETQGLGFLRGLLGSNSNFDLRRQLVFAIYLFNGAAAVADLIGLARNDPDTHVRKEAIFWLSQKASAAAVKALDEVIASPEVLEIKKHAVFALSQLPEEKGTPLLLDIARRNPHPRLRKEAIFWLGQSGDSRVLDFFEDILLK